jgi:cbb3-type cytochrome oxidase maturation protein
MSVIYILLPLALVIVASAVGAFIWAARRGQFDDVDTPAMRVVLEDDAPPTPSEAQGSPERARTGERGKPVENRDESPENGR